MKAFLLALRDLLRGLLAFPAARSAAGRDFASVLEERYRKARRCC